MRTILSSALAFAAIALIAVPASGQTIEGTFVYDAAASDDIEPAIREATAGMNFITRPIARSRLRSANPVYPQATFARDGDRVRIRLGEGAPTVTPADGTPVSWNRDDGETLQVSTQWRNNRLHHLFQAEDGSRENVYELSNDGRTLRMNVTIRSDRLPEPLRYTMVFRRQ